MKAILAGILVTVAIAIVASFAMSEAQMPAFDRFATSGVRVGDPGDNLVGPAWDRWKGDEAGT